MDSRVSIRLELGLGLWFGLEGNFPKGEMSRGMFDSPNVNFYGASLLII